MPTVWVSCPFLPSGHTPDKLKGTANAWKDTADLTFLALSAGYTHLDTAWHYKNARSTGEGMRRYFEASGKVREDVYVTYKGGSIEDDPAEDRGMAWYLKEGLQEVSPTALSCEAVLRPGLMEDSLALTMSTSTWSVRTRAELESS